MNFDFLKHFGQIIGSGVKAGAGAVKTGVGKGIGGIKTGIGKLGEMGEDDDDERYGDGGGNSGFNLPNLMKQQRQRPVPMTPGFNPDASMPSLKAPMTGSDSGMIGHDPRLRNLLPQLARPDAPSFEPIRDNVNIQSQLPSGQVNVTPQQTQMIPLRSPSPMVSQSFGQQNIPMAGRAPEGQMDRRQNVPIPQLPGHHGEPIPYNELDAAKWDKVYSKMQHSDDGRRETGVKRSWKTALANSVLAMNKSFQDAGGHRNPDAWKAGLAGGAVGGVGSYIAPQAGEEVNFDWAHRPEIEDRMQRQRQDQDRGFEMQKRGADLEGVRARTNATIAGTKDPQLERLKAQSQIDKANAQTEAIRTGKPQKFMQFDPDTGQYIQGWKYPDGREEYGGQSGEAQLKREGYENQRGMNTDRAEGQNQRTDKQIGARKVIVGMQQGGANYRKGMGEAGQNARTDKRISAQYGDTYVPPQGAPPPVGSVPNLFPGINKPAASGSPREQFIQKAIEAGHSRKAAEAEATKRKY